MPLPNPHAHVYMCPNRATLDARCPSCRWIAKYGEVQRVFEFDQLLTQADKTLLQDLKIGYE